MSLLDVWPLFELRLRTPRLTLRPLADEDLPGLLKTAEEGIHPADQMPFAWPWTRATGAELRRNVVRFQWKLRSEVRPDNWSINFVVQHGEHLIGMQDLSVTDFAALKTVRSGSWLGQRFQGLGLGTEMRAAVLLFAFDELGAEWAESGAATWNTRSLGVSRRLGYRENGISRHLSPEGDVFEEQKLRLSADEFRRPDWSLEVTGLDAARVDLLL
jgi:RimJ/RimL family protein N-acetyltransferase